jgi:hypothetical protein
MRVKVEWGNVETKLAVAAMSASHLFGGPLIFDSE